MSVPYGGEDPGNKRARFRPDIGYTGIECKECGAVSSLKPAGREFVCIHCEGHPYRLAAIRQRRLRQRQEGARQTMGGGHESRTG